MEVFASTGQLKLCAFWERKNDTNKTMGFTFEGIAVDSNFHHGNIVTKG